MNGIGVLFFLPTYIYIVLFIFYYHQNKFEVAYIIKKQRKYNYYFYINTE